ncbi:MAG: PAS domain S-box protein, partial [Phenylobacterium sp.]|nr:PAS domain S-box protein [Phenylobacterium sp.]
MLTPPPELTTLAEGDRDGLFDDDVAEMLRRVMALFIDAPGGMIVTSGPRHVVAMMNRAYAAWIGGRDVIGTPVAEAFPNLETVGFLAVLDDVYATGQSRVANGRRTLVIGPDGQSRHAYVNYVLQPIRDASGAVCGLFCQGHDVTRERVATDALKTAHVKLSSALTAAQTVFDHSHDIICTVDDEGRFQEVNRHAQQLWGYSPTELIGEAYLDFVHPEDHAATVDIARQVMAGQTTTTFTNRFVHQDGSIVPIMWSGVWSPEQRRLFAIGRDMREHAAAEEKLRQAQKMEALGRLSGGIAHDFNNLLTVVIGATETLTEALADRPEAAAVARMAQDAAQRGADLVRQLLAISRTQPLAPQTIHGGRFLETLLPMLQRTLPKNIEISLAASTEAVCCLADPTQLTSALLNLGINARDAMPDGGRLTLAVGRQADEQGRELVTFSVEDTGEGMTPQTLARALEPFFTTKAEGQGSGLGLSMVHGFAEQSGGRLEIRSERGRGTQVSVSLPRTDPCPEPVRPTMAPCRPRVGLNVLLVDDDDLVRAHAQRQLEALGCEVRSCADGHRALDMLASGGRVDLLVTDVNMPGGLNGRQLADHARLLIPDLKILFSSGHTDDPVLKIAGLDPRSAFL